MNNQLKQLILEHNSIAHIIVGRMYKALGHKVEYQDLLQYAYLGLIDAIERFKPKIETSFDSYAAICIRGYIFR